MIIRTLAVVAKSESNRNVRCFGTGKLSYTQLMVIIPLDISYISSLIIHPGGTGAFLKTGNP